MSREISARKLRRVVRRRTGTKGIENSILNRQKSQRALEPVSPFFAKTGGPQIRSLNTWASYDPLPPMTPQLEMHPVERPISPLDLDVNDTTNLLEMHNELPMQPRQVLRAFGRLLSVQERGEILKFPQVYFIGNLPLSQRKEIYSPMSREYIIKIGDHIEYRYQVIAIMGQGTFGKVVKAFDHKHKMLVAIKAFVNDEEKYIGKEIKMLQQLNQYSHPYIVRGYKKIRFRGQLFLSQELLGPHLYTLSRAQYDRKIDNSTLKQIARCILSALNTIHQSGIIHCDLKPENILQSLDNPQIYKIIDFGTAGIAGERHSSYLQSRYYRAPEVVLRIPYSFPIDIWSFGCIMAELAIGRVLFPGENEHEMMTYFMGCLGATPTSMLNHSDKADVYFNKNKRPLIVKIKEQVIAPGSTPLESILEGVDSGLVDLIKQCLKWHPHRRIGVKEALEHEWLE